MKAIDKLGSIITARPRTALLVIAVVSLIALAGAARLTLITDYRQYFDPTHPDRIAFNELEDTFGGTDDILLALQHSSGDATSVDAIRQLTELADGLQGTPFAERITSVADIPVAIAGAGGPQIITLRDLANEADPNPELWSQVVAEAAKFTSGTLLARDRSIAAAHVRVTLPEDNDFFDTLEVLSFTEKVRDAAEARHPDSKVLLVGVLPYYHAVMQLAIRDIYVLFPFCLLIAILLLRFLLASWRSAWVCCTPVLFAVITTVGLNGWLGMPVTVATLIVPIIVLVISLAYAVHFADTHLQIRDQHDSAESAARDSLRQNIEPAILAAGTTLLGFLAMNFCISPPYRDMGNISALGVLIAVSYVVILMPAMLAWVDPPFTRKKGLLRRALEGIGDRFSKPITNSAVLILTSGTILAVLAFIPRNDVDDNISEWFADDTRLRSDNLTVDEQLTGMQQLYYVLPAKMDGGIHNPTYLSKIEAFMEWLRQQPGVTGVRGLPTLVRSLSYTFGDGSGEFPVEPMETEQLLYLYEFSAPPGDQAGGLMTSDRDTSLVHVAIRNQAGHQFQAFDRKAKAWLDKHAPELGARNGNSGVMMFSKMALQNIPPMLIGTLSVLIFAAIVVAIVLKSVRLGLISIVPNLLPIGLAFGTWGIFSGHVGIALSVISAAALGIIVDDCIHLLERYKEGRKGGTASPGEACQHAIRRVGGAITITTVVLCVGIGLLGLSNVQPTHELGLWLALAIGYAWLCDLFILPQLLIRYDSQMKTSPESTESAS